jgi:hypothetical protein
MAEVRPFYCLRCQYRFAAAYDAKAVVERSCPKCGSNSVRPAPVTPAGKTADAKGDVRDANDR